MESAAFILMAIIVLLIAFAIMAVKVVHQHEKGLVERFGRYAKTVDPGLRIIVPFKWGEQIPGSITRWNTQDRVKYCNP